MARKNALGKGLAALIPEVEEVNYDKSVVELNINDIEPNINQPRKNFDEEKIAGLAESIEKHGVIQPLIVTKINDVYKIIAGERRWRAARVAGLKQVPVIIKEASKRDVLEMALIENIQREDLNPIEEAEAYDRLIKEFNLTQENLSQTIGKSRSAIANTLRLLNLCQDVRDMLVNGELTAGHARALITIESATEQVAVAEEIIKRGLNVRQTEELVRRLNEPREEETDTKDVIKHEAFEAVEESLRNLLGTKVRLVEKDNKGKIEISYYSADDRERILELLNKIKD